MDHFQKHPYPALSPRMMGEERSPLAVEQEVMGAHLVAVLPWASLLPLILVFRPLSCQSSHLEQLQLHVNL